MTTKGIGGSMNATDVPAPTVGSEREGQYLRGKRLEERFEGSETPQTILTSDKGIRHERDDESKTVAPGDSCAAVAAITDERVLLIVGGNSDESGNPNRSVSLPYTEIRSVETNKGVLKSRLTVTARTSDRYHFLVGGREDLDEVAATITRGINHWVAVDRRLSKAKEHLSTVDDHLEAGEPRAAADAYRRTRELIGEGRDVADRFRSGTHAMHRRIEQVESRLTLTRIRGYEVRAAQYVETADRAREAGEFGRAFDAYQSALEGYDRAASLAADAAPQRVEEFEEQKSEVRGALSRIKTGPLVSAMDACETAKVASEPVEAVEAWQDALRKCHDALVLVHRHDGFDGDYDALRWQVEWAAGNLLDAHERVVDRAESRGDDWAGEDDAAAAEAYTVALGHAESAASVAGEFRSGSATNHRTTAEQLREKLVAVTDA